MSARHWEFVQECLIDLRYVFHKLGQPLMVRRGTMSAVLTDLQANYKINTLYSLEETGNAWVLNVTKRWRLGVAKTQSL